MIESWIVTRLMYACVW